MPLLSDVDKLIKDIQKIRGNINDAQARVIINKANRVFQKHPKLAKKIEKDINNLRVQSGMINVIE